jgi:cytochrome c556
MGRIGNIAAAIGVAAVMALAGFAGNAPAASMSNDQLVAARVAAMKEDGQILRGAGKLSGDAAVKAATTILKNFTNFPSLFKQGSITPDSRALPAIWENWGDFTARLAAEKANAQAMLKAAKADDTKSYQAAVAALKAPCSDCHVKYARIF